MYEKTIKKSNKIVKEFFEKKKGVEN